MLSKKLGYWNGLLLVLLSTGLQLYVLFGGLDLGVEANRLQLGIIEMLLIILLWGNGARIYLSLKNEAVWMQHLDDVQRRFVIRIAALVWLSLSLCVLGDLVNRNFPELYFQHGSQVEHTYLADSVWFFFPGYAVFIYAVYLIARGKGLSPVWLYGVTAVFVAGGLLSFLDMHQPGTGIYVTLMTGSYALLIPLMAAGGIILVKVGGWQRMKWVALGCVLATVADALIGNFWIYGQGYYPDIRAVNWIVYFLSQALIQRLPIRLLG